MQVTCGAFAGFGGPETNRTRMRRLRCRLKTRTGGKPQAGPSNVRFQLQGLSMASGYLMPCRALRPVCRNVLLKPVPAEP